MHATPPWELLVTKGLRPALSPMCEVLGPGLVDSKYSVKGAFPSLGIYPVTRLPPSPAFVSLSPSCRLTLDHCRCAKGLTYLYLPLSVHPGMLRQWSGCRQNPSVHAGWTHALPRPVLKVQTRTGKLQGERLFHRHLDTILGLCSNAKNTSK